MYQRLKNWFTGLLHAQHFYARAGRWSLWYGVLAALLLGAGIVGGLFLAPPDYQQGESVRIIYVHVPAAWMSLFIYMVMAGAAVFALVWRAKLAELAVACAAPIGAWFTAVALATGALWGKPMWGTWWTWDARLTSELILLFLYLGVMGLYNAVEDKRRAARAAALLALVGVVNVPIIHYSVDWWNTLHQPATIARLAEPAIHISMLIPLLLMALGAMAFFACSFSLRLRAAVLNMEQGRQWVKRLALSNQKTHLSGEADG